MPNGQVNPAFNPVYRAGAPGARAPVTAPYFDTSTNPYTFYIWHNGAWHAAGDAGTIDATQIQGVNVSATPPTPTQTLIYNVSGAEYEPG
jgi:hypothetical protein